jgi:REP element-mobilizing transposase RayT
MPNHIHAIILFQFETAGASLRPTLNDIIRTFKSISTIACNQQDDLSGRKIWQSSYYEHIIRNQHSYEEIWQYIDNNPLKWELDELYVH